MDSSLTPSPYSATSQTRPIPIPPRRLSTSRPNDSVNRQPEPEYPSLINRKRREPRETMHFKEVNWHGRQEIASRDHIAPLRAGSSSRSSSVAGSKRALSKENGNGLLRRTSASCKHKFQKAIGSRSRRSSADGMDVLEGTSSRDSTPSQYSNNRTFVDRIAQNKMLSHFKVSRYDTPAPAHGAASSLHHAPIVPSQRPATAHFFDSSLSASSQPFSPFNPHAGTAARKAAAESNLHYSEYERDQNRRRLGSNSSAADSGADLCSSDVEMLDAEEVDEKIPIKTVNPMERLPAELNSMIFSYLDVKSLRQCQSVSKAVRSLAKDSLIWRGEFLGTYQRDSFVTPAPIQIGGAGIGKAQVKRQNWELMHKVREQINDNWKAGQGRAVYMSGHTDSVYCVQFDEQKIITGSRDRTIRVWDINTHRCIKVIGGPNVRPQPGPRTLRTVDYPSFLHSEASVNGTAYGNHIYHVPTDYHSASILCLQYDEEILVTGSSDNDLIVWDVKTYEPVQRLKHHQGGVLDVAFDADHIVSCSKDCTIVVWDRKTLKPLRTLTGHNGPVNAVQLRGNLLVSASGDGVARLWDLNKMECVREFPAKERGLAAVEFSDDAKYVLAGGNDHVTYKFSVETGKEVLQYTGHTQLVRSLFLDTQNKRVVSGSYDLDLRVYDYETGKSVTVFQEWTTSWMLAAKCDYRRIVSTSQDGRILMIDFGINNKDKSQPIGVPFYGIDLLRGAEPAANQELDHLYPSYNHPSGPKR